MHTIIDFKLSKPSEHIQIPDPHVGYVDEQHALDSTSTHQRAAS